MKRSEIIFSSLLLPSDFFALLVAFALSYYIRDQFLFLGPINVGSLGERLKYAPSGAIVLTFDHYLHYIAFIIPAMLVIFSLVGLYAIRSNATWIQRVARILIGVSVGEFFILLLFLLKKDFFLPRSTVIYSWILGVAFVLLGRVVILLIQKALHVYDVGVIRVGVVGNTPAAFHLSAQIQKYRFTSYRLVTHLKSASVAELQDAMARSKLDEIIIANDDYTDEDLIAVRNYCLEEHVGFSFVPSLLTALSSTFEIRNIVNLPMIEVRPTPLEGWGRVQKRFFDLMFATLLIILFSPVYLVIAVLMMFFSPGPLIFRHKRIGRQHKPIYVSKFRSLKAEWGDINGHISKPFQDYLSTHPEAAQEWAETMKLENDPRVSTMGKILRKTRLDELPQFFDVLSGDLSLVGPRPIVDSEVARFGEKARILFTVKPGVTGLWQVNGGNKLSYEERVRLNTYYIEHWSISLDLVTMVRTGGILLSGIVSGGKESGSY
jgi:exopolysaccharide biosynthesis polyprenyl glycosylphosphotransferase